VSQKRQQRARAVTQNTEWLREDCLLSAVSAVKEVSYIYAKPKEAARARRDAEDGVRAAGLLVQRGLGGAAARGAAVEQRVDVQLAAHDDLLQALRTCARRRVYKSRVRLP
jgi:hypothetical protein